MKEITVDQFKENPFTLIGDEWMLVTAQDKDQNRTNMMTASWGSIGIFWNKPTLTVYIRQSRHTKKLLDEQESFSVSVMPPNLKTVHKICSTTSGRNTDKVKATDLKVEFENDIPYFSDAKITFICKKLFTTKMEKVGFMEEEPFNKNYTNGDLHSIYIAEIKKILIQS